MAATGCETCYRCKWFFEDRSVGFADCMAIENMSDAQFEEFENHGYLKDCPYFKKKQEEFYS